MSPPEAERANHRTVLPKLIGVVLVSAVLAAIWLKVRADPVRLCEQGLQIGRSDPVAGERLLRRAIAAAGGQYPDAEAALCVILARQGNWSGAESQFAKVDKQICRTDLLMACARGALADGHDATALEALQAVRQRRNRDSVAALEVLIAYFQSWGREEEVITAARELARLEPREPRHWSLLIDTLAAAVRREAECLAAVREALAQDLPVDSLPEFERKLVEQLIVSGDAHGARRELERHRSQESDSFRWRTFELDVLRLEGKLDEALVVMNGLFSEIRDRPLACLNRGVIYLDLGRYDDAVRDLEQAIAGRPVDASAHFKLSEAYRGLGRDEAARRHREIAARIGKTREEIGMLQKQLVRDPFARSTYERIAELYQELGEEESARQWAERAAQIRPPPTGS